MATIQVALVEDQPLTRQGLTALIGGTPGYGCAGSWRTCEEMLERWCASRAVCLELNSPAAA